MDVVTNVRVVCGPDWKSESEDGGEGQLGTVVAVKSPSVSVFDARPQDVGDMMMRLHFGTPFRDPFSRAFGVPFHDLFAERQPPAVGQTNGMVVVQWDNGNRREYRYGSEGSYLRVYDSAQAG